MKIKTPIGYIEVPKHKVQEVEHENDKQLLENLSKDGFIDPVRYAECKRRKLM